MMKRSLSLVAAFAFIGNVLIAQNVEQGKKFLYYERYKSAKETFDKVLASNPNNLDAAYWLGQLLLDKRNTVSRDTVAAKALYQKYLTQNGNAPLLLAGMGQIELSEGKKDEARAHFEQALTASKNKDVDVFNAVARANVDAKGGDAAYAIEKLKAATEVKKFKDPETYILMGDAYRILIDGGNAVQSYQKALELDPQMAAAKHSIARVYLTQNNPDYFVPAFEDAIKLDPAYAPTYFELYYYYYFRDVNKASGYLDQYVANSDPGPEQESMKADLLYASGKFAEAKAKANELLTQTGDKAPIRLYRMLAYANDTLGDREAAKKAMTTLFEKAAPEEILPADYEGYGKILVKIPGSENEAYGNFMKAIEKDTAVANKVKYANSAVTTAKNQKDTLKEAEWLGVAYKLDKDPSQKALFDWGFANYRAKNYPAADSIFCNLYQTKFPAEIYGYMWCARTAVAKDTSLQQGLFVDPYKKLIAFTDTVPDSAKVKYKAVTIEGHLQLAQFYANVKQQNDSAASHLEAVVALDPSRTELAKMAESLRNPPKQQSQPARKEPAAKGAAPKKKPAGQGK